MSELKIDGANIRVDAEGTTHIEVDDLSVDRSSLDTLQWRADRVVLCLHVRGVAPCEGALDVEPCFMRLPAHFTFAGGK
jgi:hypothetical protein